MPFLEIPSRGSFKRQVILTFVVGFFFLIAAFAIYLVNTENENLHHDSVNETTSMAQSLAASALPWVLANDVAGLQEAVHAFRAYPELNYAMVISPTGKVLAHSDATKVGLFVTDEQSLALLKAPHENRVMVDNKSMIDVAVPIEIDRRHVGWARVGAGKKGNAAILRKMIWNNMIFLLLATTFSFIAAMLIANRLGRRIGSLVRVAEDVQAGNFATRVRVADGTDEITTLGNSLNKMLDTLSQNELDLRAASLYTRSLIEASLDPLVTISAEGKITDVNQATEKATGRSRSELVGTDFADYFTEPEKARAGYQKVFADGSVTDYPLALRHLDGHITDVLYNASVYRDSDGKVLGVFAAARDITERKQVEEELAQLSLQNRLILDSAGEGIYGLDIGGRCTFVNPAASQSLGFGVGELIGQYSHPTFHHTKPDGSPYPEEECPVHAAYKDGVVRRGEDQYYRKDGSSFPVEFISTPILEAGKITGAVVTFRDITERKLAVEALRKSEEKYRRIVDTANEGIWVLGADTVTTFVNARMAEMLGYSVEEMIGRPATDFFFEEDVSDHLRKMEMRREGLSENYERRFRHKNGETVWTLVSGTPIFDREHRFTGSVAMLTDITERKKAEQGLRESEEKFSLAFHASPDLLSITRPDGTILDVNEGYTQILGYSRDESIGKTTLTLSIWADPADRATFIAGLKEFGHITNFETRLRRKDGTLITVIDAGRFIKLRGEPCVLSIAHDISERKRAEETLRQSEEKYRTLIQKIQAAVIVHGADTQILISNSMAQELLGLSEDQLLGKTAVDPDWHYFREDGTAAPLDEYPVNRVLASRSALRNFIIGVHRPLRENDVWVLVNADPVFGKEGGITQVIVTFIDITERRQTEEALKKSEERLRLEVARMPIAYIIWDKDFRVTTWNPAAENIFGYTFDEAKGQHPYNIIVPPEAQSQVDAVWSRLLAGDASAHSVNENQTKDGRIIICEWTNTPLIKPDGTVLGVMSMVQDITERKLAEDEVRALNRELEQRVASRTAELESANKELEAFSYSVSHDLRSPLRAIDGFSHILLEDYAARLDEEGKRLLKVVMENTIKMGQLIDDILKFSRTGRFEMTFTEIDMGGLAREVYEELRPVPAGHEPQMEIGQLPSSRGDRAMMRQVFVNLLSNAIKFTRNKEPARIEVGAFTGENEIVYFVRDNGAGFDMRYVDRLFGVFQRLHTESEFEGTGIGLAIVKRIIVRHGGRVWAEGKLNGGATFYFALPAAPGETPC